MKYLNQIYLFLFSGFCFLVPFNDFGEAIPNIFLAATGIIFFFVIKKGDFKKLKDASFFVFIAMIVLISIQSMFLNRWEDFEMITRFLIVPAILILQLPLKNHKIPIYAFLAGTLTLVILAGINIGRIYLLNGTLDFAGENVNEIILGERPYLGFICVMVFCLSIYNGFKLFDHNKKQSFLFYALAVLFLGFIFIISARISLLSIVIILFIYLMNFQNKKIRYGLLLGSLLVFFVIFLVNKDLKKRFFLTENSYTIEEMLKFEPRYHIWRCSFFLIKKKPYLGWGFENGQNKLRGCYAKSENFIDKEQQDYYVRSRFNSHNQFLNFFLSEGWLYLILFILFFGINFYQNRKIPIATALLISLFLFCCVENVLSRQMGCLLFGFVWVISCAFNQKSKRL
jgi:hypothetical protein